MDSLIVRELQYPGYDPPPNIILGLVVWPYITDSVEGRHNAPLHRLFQFLEVAAESDDWELRNALGVSLIEGLVGSQEVMRRCWPLMGPKLREMATTFAEALGCTENIPD
jgi:hypothetical protein